MYVTKRHPCQSFLDPQESRGEPLRTNGNKGNLACLRTAVFLTYQHPTNTVWNSMGNYIYDDKGVKSRSHALTTSRLSVTGAVDVVALQEKL